MTVRMLKKELEKFNDDDRIIIDLGDTFRAEDYNEIMYAYKHKKYIDKDYAPVVILQTRSDYDVEEEIKAEIAAKREHGMDSELIIKDLYERGYSYDEFEHLLFL